MKKELLMTIAIILLSAILSACTLMESQGHIEDTLELATQESTVSYHSEKESDVSITETTETTQPSAVYPEDYTAVLLKYQRARNEGWNRVMCVENGLSRQTPIEHEHDGLYYALSDLNDDGIEELVIAEYPYREDTDTNFIDIYTIVYGEVVHFETDDSISPAEMDFTEIIDAEVTNTLTGYEGYDYIIHKYVTALTENWTWEQCQQNDISPSILSDATTVRSNLGWCLLDIDKNGAEELVISDGVELFDLYVMQPDDGGPGHLLSACPNFYQLCENGLILCREYYSGRGTWRWLRLAEPGYIQKDLVEYDGQLDQYYYGTDGTDGHRLTPISKDEAGNLISRYQAAELTLTPFVEQEPFVPNKMD